MLKDLRILEWQFDVIRSVEQHQGITPVLVSGIDPEIDLLIVDASEKKPIWFYYDVDDYSIHYWRQFLKNKPKDIEALISTSFIISERLDLDILDTPELWVIALEKI